MSFAPIAIFAYNRPDHVEVLLNSLIGNIEYKDSPITVYCDGPRTEDEVDKVKQTRKIIKKLLPTANIVEREKNLGLANSLIKGVSEQCNKYGRVIVFEDDLELAKDALAYFNKALDTYVNEDQVMHISGYRLPIEKSLNKSFFFREASCWGWATWQRAWQHFQSDSRFLMDYLFKNRLISEFNTNNSYMYWEMLNARRVNKIDSWAIHWYASIFIKKGLALYPGHSKIRNTGLDGSGIHCSETTEYDVNLSEGNTVFPDKIKENKEVLNAVMNFRYKGIYGQLDNLMRNYLALYRYLREI